MSATPSAKTPKSALAIGYLALTFAAGLLVVYSVGAYIPQQEQAEETQEPAAPATEIAEEAPADGMSAAIQSALDMQSAKTQTLGAELAETQRRMDALEAELAALEQDRNLAFERQRKQLADELAEIVRAAQPAPEQEAPSVEPKNATVTLREALASLEPRQTPDGLLISLAESELRFAPGSADLSATRPTSLSKLTELLSEHPEVQILLRGHTDSQGSASGNLSLSERRALAVKELLVASGIEEQRIQAEGRGETAPIAANETADGRARNRRVELYLMDPRS